MEDNRSKYFVFVPFCLMAQSYQAEGLVKYEWKASIKPFMELFINEDINIIQMPCAEASFNNSLRRKPQGITKYNTKEFNEHCNTLAASVAANIEEIIKSRYQVIAILGIEQSPSCCVNYIYTNKGMEKRQGLFMEKLNNKIAYLNIPIIGINRKFINKSLNELVKLIRSSKNHENIH